MARDGDDATRRRREREDEEEAAQQAKKASVGEGGKVGLPGSIGGDSEQLASLIERAEPLIEQLNNLYNQYIVGAEQRPPLERRKQLDQLMMTVQMMGKPTPTMQFRASTLTQRYTVNRERWDKMIKDLESGKIKRLVGPKRA